MSENSPSSEGFAILGAFLIFALLACWASHSIGYQAAEDKWSLLSSSERASTVDECERRYERAVREIRSEAVKRGYGHWTVGYFGETQFEWEKSK
jgi:hypothetical protein